MASSSFIITVTFCCKTVNVRLSPESSVTQLIEAVAKEKKVHPSVIRLSIGKRKMAGHLPISHYSLMHRSMIKGFIKPNADDNKPKGEEVKVTETKEEAVSVNTAPIQPVGAAKVTRGAFILFEGLDRTGKTTQSLRLAETLNAVHQRFPDRSTSIGKMLDGYLRNAVDTDDRAIHLLFAANRWECVPSMLTHIDSGKHLVVDSYSYSGAAFSSSKERAGVDLDWCMAPERGLPLPDVVIYLSMTPEAAAKRGAFGVERYEKKKTQTRVAKLFDKLRGDRWRVIDADASIDDIAAQIKTIANETIRAVQLPPPAHPIGTPYPGTPLAKIV